MYGSYYLCFRTLSGAVLYLHGQIPVTVVPERITEYEQLFKMGNYTLIRLYFEFIA